MNDNTIPMIHVTSLGCSKNWVDTEIIVAGLLQSGFGLAPDAEDADLWLINTCGFIRSARDEAESVIRTAVKWKKKEPTHRKIIVSGCLPAWQDFEIIRECYPGVDLWTRPEEVPEVANRVAMLWNGDKLPARKKTPYLYDHHTPRVQLTPEHYAYVKIADGCDNCCSYCAIPSIRGKNRSRTIESVVAEVRNLVALGVREIILIGQDITRFGEDRPGDETLAQLIRAIDEIEGDFWLRLLYLHPARYTDELTELYKTSKHLIPYLEMPIQHINADVLASMNRAIDPERIKTIFRTLRADIPQLALRTTFILGYPGETNEAFEEVMDLLREVRFDRVGAFVFQPEPGTPAASLPNTVDPKVAKLRYRRLMTLQNQISYERNSELIGKEVEIIVDEVDGKWLTGRTYRDAPEIDNKVIIEHTPRNIEPGERVIVRITDAEPYELLAKYIRRIKRKVQP